MTQNEVTLIVICVTLLVIILLLLGFGVVTYKMYLRSNSEQLRSHAQDFNRIANESNEQMEKCHSTMIELLKIVDHLKAKE